MLTPEVINNRDGTITITMVPIRSLLNFMREYYGTTNFINVLAKRTGVLPNGAAFNLNVDRLTIYEFFVPELIFIFEEITKSKFSGPRNKIILQKLKTETWCQGLDHLESIPNNFDMSVFGTVIKPELKPLPAQLEFIRDHYWKYKVAFRLRGYLLSLPPGCGKSLTSLFLAAGLRKTKLIIIAPLSTVKNVWVTEVNKAFVTPRKIATSIGKEPVTATTDTVIINYEAIENYTPMLTKYFSGQNTMVIVDECHNFKDIKSKRTIALCGLCEQLGCEDILLMSGTPVKAFGTEALPILKLLACYYDITIEERFKALQRYPKIMNVLMCHRLGMMMFRKTKEEVFTLPPKHELDLLVKIADGDKFTLPNVRVAMEKYRAEREQYYAATRKTYEAMYDSAIAYYQTIIARCIDREQIKGFKRYMSIVEGFRTRGYSMLMAAAAHEARVYEDTYIIPSLPNNLKRDFKASRAVVKYVSLKILGEVLGNLLGGMRIEMTTKMLEEPRIREIIEYAEKKTLLFSSYNDTLKLAERKCKEWGFKPMLIDGTNSKQAQEIVAKFKADENANPLIASLQVMSTGHTINEANTVIFLNVPFRSVDYEQASDRCYRIGQDTEVFIYKLILDTGEIPNLSTRMHDIVSWSREQFNEIMGDDQGELEQAALTKEFTDMVRGVPGLPVPNPQNIVADAIGSVIDWFR